MCDGFSEALLGAAAAGGEAGAGAAAAGSAAGLSATQWALLGGSGLLSGVSAGMQAGAQQQAAGFQAQVAANNARLAAAQGANAVEQGQLNAMQRGLQAGQLLGEQKAALAGNGVNLGSGSAVDLQATTRYLNAGDVTNITNAAAREAWGYGVDAANYAGQSALDAWQARNNDPAAIGALGGASSLLGSATLYAMAGRTNLFTSLTGAA